jgi:hypothetical protein
MNIVKKLEQYNEDHVYFLEPIKNNIMNNGRFIRIIYSTPLFTLNGIYSSLNINNLSIDKYHNKYRCSFDITQYRDLIDNLRIFEEGLIKKIGIMKIFNAQAIEDFYTELEIINEREDNGDIDWEDYEIERQKLLLVSLHSYFGAKYFDLNDTYIYD